MIHFPAALTVSASAGSAQLLLGPAHTTRPSRSTTTAFGTTAPPIPSTSVAPTNARGGGAAPGVGNAVVTATFQPSGVRTNTRSLTPRALAPLSTTR